MNKTLIAIQQELKAPKGQYNSFGKYKYRSCEDILEALKPLLAKHEACVWFEDLPYDEEGWHYIKAVLHFQSKEGEIKTSAVAREAETKTGMDASQITGTASSYARKYALNGLFLIDDTKDADTDEYHKTTKKPTAREKLMEYIKRENLDAKDISKRYGLTKGTKDERFKEVLDILTAETAGEANV